MVSLEINKPARWELEEWFYLWTGGRTLQWRGPEVIYVMNAWDRPHVRRYVWLCECFFGQFLACARLLQSWWSFLCLYTRVNSRRETSKTDVGQCCMLYVAGVVIQQGIMRYIWSTLANIVDGADLVPGGGTGLISAGREMKIAWSNTRHVWCWVASLVVAG